jgi:GH18 family chitinase
MRLVGYSPRESSMRKTKTLPDIPAGSLSHVIYAFAKVELLSEVERVRLS